MGYDLFPQSFSFCFLSQSYINLVFSSLLLGCFSRNVYTRVLIKMSIFCVFICFTQPININSLSLNKLKMTKSCVPVVNWPGAGWGGTKQINYLRKKKGTSEGEQICHLETCCGNCRAYLIVSHLLGVTVLCCPMTDHFLENYYFIHFCHGGRKVKSGPQSCHLDQKQKFFNSVKYHTVTEMIKIGRLRLNGNKQK